MLTDTTENQPDNEAGDIDLGRFAPYLFHNLDRHFQQTLGIALAPHGLTVAEWRTLFCLHRSGVCSIDDICKFIHLPQPTVSRTVQQLHRKKLVRRSRNKVDNRTAEIRISREGERRHRVATAAVRLAADDEIRLLAGRDGNDLFDILRKMLQRLGPEKFHDLD